jgi:two-component system, LytTR family, sensor kinase
MTIQDFILSDKTSYRLSRHCLFWIFYVAVFHFQNDNRTFLYSASFLPAIVLSVYIFLYVLLTQLQRKKYALFILGLILSYGVIYLLAFWGSNVFFSQINEPVPVRVIWGLALHNQTIAMCAGGVAMCIKATKKWYVSEKENRALQKQKARNELNLEKANLYPEFILQALKSLHEKINDGATESPIVLLKLSDTLSYILYDSQNESIELEKELSMVENIIAFKKLAANNNFAIHLSVAGDGQHKHVAPLTLFRLIQNLFQIIATNEEYLSEVSIKIQIESNSLSFQLTAIYSCGPNELEHWREVIAKTRTQLNGLYYSAYDFKVAEEEYMYSISLGLGLNRINSIEKKISKVSPNEYILAQTSSL